MRSDSDRYRLHYVDMGSDAHRAADFLRLNPTGRIPALGYANGRTIGELLHVEGWRVNHKKVERLWREEGLPTTGPRNCHPDGSEAGHALTLNMDQSDRAAQRGKSKRQNNALFTHNHHVSRRLPFDNSK